MNATEAVQFAQKHVATWNSHHLDAILRLYSEHAELHSPLAGTLRGETVVRGREALREYFVQGLTKYPDLRFELLGTFLCQTSVTLLFNGAGGKRVCEVLFLDAAGTIEREYAHYLCEQVSPII